MTLLLPTTPPNLHLKEGIRAQYIDSDLYNICGRLQEIDRSLFVVQLDDSDDCSFAIMEHCADGNERLIFRVPELDGRVLERIREMMSIPLHERLERLEKMEYKWEAEREQEMHDMLYEKLGVPMRHYLHKCGFADTHPVSYPKSGVTGGKGSKRKS